MKLRFVYGQKYLEHLGIRGVTLYPFVLFSETPEGVSDSLLRHELEHCYQVRRQGFLKFYLSYLYFYIRGRLRYRHHALAYRNIPYEVEARRAELLPLSADERALRGKAPSRV